MDNPISESNAAAAEDNQAVGMFESFFNPSEKFEETPETAAERLAEQDLAGGAEEGDDAEKSEVETEQQPEQEDDKVTVEVDGKSVSLTKAEIAELHKSGLRQADYTRKTMETADVRKSAEAEKAAAKQERDAYAQKLHVLDIQLSGDLERMNSQDWQTLIDNDPVEYMKQQRIAQERQAALQQVQQEARNINQQQQAEQQQAEVEYFRGQQQALLAKLPEWKDEAVAKAESDKIKTFLAAKGFTADEIRNVRDHKTVIMHRNAMLYENLMARAATATKKVAAAPARVERPGVAVEAQSKNPVIAARKQLARTGSDADAVNFFAANGY